MKVQWNDRAAEMHWNDPITRMQRHCKNQRSHQVCLGVLLRVDGGQRSMRTRADGQDQHIGAARGSALRGSSQAARVWPWNTLRIWKCWVAGVSCKAEQDGVSHNISSQMSSLKNKM